MARRMDSPEGAPEEDPKGAPDATSPKTPQGQGPGDVVHEHEEVPAPEVPVDTGPGSSADTTARDAGMFDPGRDSAERVQSRDYGSDFAALPDAELEGTAERPGPAGSGIDATSWPLVIVAIGFVLLLAATFFAEFFLLYAGLVLVVGGAIWSGASHRRARRSAPR